MNYQNNLAFAQDMDQKDPLRKYRDEFLFPNPFQTPIKANVKQCKWKK